MTTELHVAILEDEIETVFELINDPTKISESIDDETWGGNTALQLAVQSNNFQLSKLLVNAGANVDIKNEDGDVALHFAVQLNNFQISKLLVGASANVNKVNDDGYTPLHYAVKSNNYRISKLLVETGANVNARSNVSKNTPLELAIKSRNIKILKLFLKFITDVNSKDPMGYTPIHRAAAWGSSDVVRLLLSAGASVNVKNNDRSTPLHEVVGSENMYIIELLTYAGADLSAKNNEEETPLHLVVGNGTAKNVLKFLLKAGADVRAKDQRGNTLLHTAIYWGCTFFLKTLIKAGADANEFDNRGETAFTTLVKSCIANVSGYDSLIEEMKLLIECTNVNLIHANGKNLLTLLLESDSFLNNKYVYEVVLEYVAKLRSLNFSVDSTLLDTITHSNNYYRYFKMCLQELDKAKGKKLHNCWVTFYNLLVDDDSKFIKYAGNKDLTKDFEQNVQNFPIYGSIMQKNVNKGIKRRKLFDYISYILSQYLPIFNPTHLIIKNTLEVLRANDWKKLSE